MIAFFGLALQLGQSAPKPVTPAQQVAPLPATEDFTPVEKQALKSIVTEFGDLQKLQQQASLDLRDFQLEVSKSHPGYHFDPQKGLVKDVVKVPDSGKTEKK